MRIAIVNDRAMVVEVLRRAVLTGAAHEIAWIAYDGAQALEKCAADRPDLILMDLIMPVMDGVEATRRIMNAMPCGILVVTADIEANSGKVFEAISAGAIDAVNTPEMNAPGNAGVVLLLRKIASLAGFLKDSFSFTPDTLPTGRPKLIAIGASAGGPAAVAEVLKALPENLQVVVVVIQHLDEQFAPGFATWLQGISKLSVKVAQEGQRLTVSNVFLAGTNDHLVMKSPETMGYTPDPADYVYRPSVDAFFNSVIRHWKGDVLGVLLTGMGRDGAKGLLSLRQAGHHTLCQDQASSAVFGMPKAAIALNAAVEVLPLSKIGPALIAKVAGDGTRFFRRQL